MKLRDVSSFAVKKREHLHRLCARWFVKNFGYRGTITNVELLERNLTDMVCGIVRVRFEFKGPRGRTGDGVAFLDQEEVASGRR